MDHGQLAVVTRIAVALLIGGMIGFERTFHGRPAGFRTHSLVCAASALLMLVTVYQSDWMTVTPLEAIRTDPTRMAQGIMTGIGFLGAGVIFKEGLTVRGLTTTAASIWMTAAIGILVGVGFYLPAVIGSAATLIVLGVFRSVEGWFPSEFYAHHTIRFVRESIIPEQELRELIGRHGFTIAALSHRLTEMGKVFEYRMVIRTRDRTAAARLAQYLCTVPGIIEFRSPQLATDKFCYRLKCKIFHMWTG
jgi:putative Mg2+ transporter-C (MgtC) family protein